MLSRQTQDEARRMLESSIDYPGLPVRTRAQQAICLWRQPTFDPESSWSLIRDGETWYVRRIVYARMTDEQDGSIHHNIYGSEAIISDVEAGDLISNLSRVHLPPFVALQDRIVLDGCWYGVRCRDLIREAQVSWWCQAPNEWTELRDWYAKALSIFEACLPECSVQIQSNHPWVE